MSDQSRDLGLKRSSNKIAFILACIITGGLWTASQGWEKGLAQRLGDPDISPGGCYRVETFKPYWVLPDIFHLTWHPDGNVSTGPELFPAGGYPAFFRLYDHRNGTLISETGIYDSKTMGGRLFWGGGSGNVSVGMIHIGPNLPDCMGDRPAPLPPPDNNGGAPKEHFRFQQTSLNQPWRHHLSADQEKH